MCCLGMDGKLVYAGLLPMYSCSCFSLSSFIFGCWNKEMLGPWNDDFTIVEVGLWSILSTAAVVKSSLRSIGEQTTPFSTYDCTTASQILKTQVYDILIL